MCFIRDELRVIDVLTVVSATLSTRTVQTLKPIDETIPIVVSTSFPDHRRTINVTVRIITRPRALSERVSLPKEVAVTASVRTGANKRGRGTGYRYKNLPTVFRNKIQQHPPVSLGPLTIADHMNRVIRRRELLQSTPTLTPILVSAGALRGHSRYCPMDAWLHFKYSVGSCVRIRITARAVSDLRTATHVHYCFVRAFTYAIRAYSS